ncbi:MAG: S-layer homology domain-containing protein [Acidimicrobiia bacterium]|nr:S-layer homology domain-containing protein [Acidimicrobiia bacterium]
MHRWIRLVLAAALVLAVMTPASGADPLPPGGTFRDDDGNVHEGAIEAIAAVGITRGCNPPVNDRFCPAQSVTRGEMAAFLVRALDLDPSGEDFFSDDDGSVFEANVNALASAGITLGCNPPDNTLFCPNDVVSRGQMAAFLVRGYGFADNGGGDIFTDDDGSVFEDAIDRLATAGITRGCNPPDNTMFCPQRPVRRDEMATFLARAGGLDPLVPPERCSILPADNIWNTRIDDLPVDPNSAAYVNTIGATATLHADFGAGVWPPGSNSPIGIPFVEVDADQPEVAINYTAYGSESDPGPWPVPSDAPIEGGPDATGDRHVLVLDRDECMLYELYRAFPQGNGSWNADSGAAYDLTSNALRPDGWTSADAAGLPILPGLVTYDEVASGEITHAIRFTAPQTQRAYVWPARHFASSLTGEQYPPMGQRFRLEAGFDISGYSPEIQVILTAMKRYGIILADNGSPWFISGAPDDRWDNDMLHEWDDIPGSAFEAVDVSSLMVDPDSGRVGG